MTKLLLLLKAHSPLGVHLVTLGHVDAVFLQRWHGVLLVVRGGALDGQVDDVGLLGSAGLGADRQNRGLSQWNHRWKERDFFIFSISFY